MGQLSLSAKTSLKPTGRPRARNRRSAGLSVGLGWAGGAWRSRRRCKRLSTGSVPVTYIEPMVCAIIIVLCTYPAVTYWQRCVRVRTRYAVLNRVTGGDARGRVRYLVRLRSGTLCWYAVLALVRLTAPVIRILQLQFCKLQIANLPSPFGAESCTANEMAVSPWWTPPWASGPGCDWPDRALVRSWHAGSGGRQAAKPYEVTAARVASQGRAPANQGAALGATDQHGRHNPPSARLANGAAAHAGCSCLLNPERSRRKRKTAGGEWRPALRPHWPAHPCRPTGPLGLVVAHSQAYVTVSWPRSIP